MNEALRDPLLHLCTRVAFFLFGDASLSELSCARASSRLSVFIPSVSIFMVCWSAICMGCASDGRSLRIQLSRARQEHSPCRIQLPEVHLYREAWLVMVGIRGKKCDPGSGMEFHRNYSRIESTSD